MVSSEDVVLDEVILQVFEEHDEVFHFPVTTQKDARAFVKALHRKGLSYNCLSQEIKELEQNFSAWRTGISRPGIGNRMIERINQPLQEILLSDGEEDPDCCDQLSTSSDEVAENGKPNENGDCPINCKEDRLAAELQPDAQVSKNRTDDQKVHVNPNITNDKNDIKSGNFSNLGIDIDPVDIQATNSLVKEDRCFDGSVESNGKLVVSLEEERNEKKVTPQIEETSFELVESRDDLSVNGKSCEEVEKRLTRNEDSTQNADELNKEDLSPVKKEEQNEEIGKKKILETDQNEEIGKEKILESEDFKKRKELVGVGCRLESSNQLLDNVESNKEVLVKKSDVDTNISDTDDRKSKEKDFSSGQTGTSNLDQLAFDSKDSTEVIKEQEKYCDIRADIIAVVKTDALLTRYEVSTSADVKAQESDIVRVRPETEQHCLEYTEKKLETTSEILSCPTLRDDNVKNNLPVKEKDKNVHLATENQVYLDGTAVTSMPSGCESDSSVKEGLDKESPVLKLDSEPHKPLHTAGSRMPDSDKIFENYDSDADEAHTHDNSTVLSTCHEPDMTNQSGAKQSQWNTSGYVYVFTDSSSEEAKFRVKIGTSRFPHKKLQQALLFNIDMKLVSAVQVCDRQTALGVVQQQLSSFSIPNTTGWFLGPLETILNVLMAVAKDYPVQD